MAASKHGIDLKVQRRQDKSVTLKCRVLDCCFTLGLTAKASGVRTVSLTRDHSPNSLCGMPPVKPFLIELKLNVNGAKSGAPDEPEDAAADAGDAGD